MKNYIIEKIIWNNLELKASFREWNDYFYCWLKLINIPSIKKYSELPNFKVINGYSGWEKSKEKSFECALKALEQSITDRAANVLIKKNNKNIIKLELELKELKESLELEKEVQKYCKQYVEKFKIKKL